jgi:signal transduction histidine kinase/DNA-binding response OmpR family regulator
VLSSLAFLAAAAWRTVRVFAKRHARQRENLEAAVLERTRELMAEKARTEREKSRVEEQNREIARLFQEAEQASRLKSEFLANMSHEIRTPMNGVVGMTSLLLESGLTPVQRETAETISHSADALLAILNDILDFSKIEAGKLSIESAPFNLRLLAEEVAGILSVRANEKGLDLIFRYDPDAPQEFDGDAGRIRQVLINLVGNALKFTRAGHVLMEIECLGRNAGGALMKITVEDTGIGIPAEMTGRIFEKFTQADASTTRKFGGTGLGLAISKKLVELMGGKIGVSSVPERGSTFWVELCLPVKSDSQPEPEAQEIAGLRVLVVDDNAVNRRVFEEQLRRWSLDVKAVSSGPEALRALREARLAGAPFRIGVIDHQMPGMDGEELGLAIQADPALRASVGLILLSSAGQWATKGQLTAAGFAVSLAKPARQSQLLDALSTAWARVGGSSSAPPPISDSGASETGEAFPSGVRRARVLVAEDNAVNQKVAVKMLERLGCEVTLASNGRQAIEKLEAGNCDLIFMDCQMPDLDGFEATAEIRRRYGSAIPIVAMTANAMEGDRGRCLEAGMDDYISKPVKPASLKTVLDTWLVRSRV